METTLTAERFGQALCWMEGGDTTMDEKDVKAFLDDMLKAFRRRFGEVHPGGPVPRFRTTAPAVLSLTAIAGPELAKAVREASSASPVEQAPATKERTDVDSVTIVDAIGHIARLSGREVTASRAQMILWCVYGSWLATHGARLDIEHPQAWRYGPVFPRAYRQSHLQDASACRDAYARLSESNPDLATLVSSKTLSMLFTTMADLDGAHVRRPDSPYARVMGRSPGAWGTRIPDEYTASFFARR